MFKLIHNLIFFRKGTVVNGYCEELGEDTVYLGHMYIYIYIYI